MIRGASILLLWLPLTPGRPAGVMLAGMFIVIVLGVTLVDENVGCVATNEDC